ncbi:hypothetical protein VTO42DRAFT_4988 [Malbranchea cinnamomea]
MSFCRCFHPPVTSSVTKLAVNRGTVLRQCLHTVRSFSSSGRAFQSSKRELQTATAFRPHTLPEGFPLARNAGTPETSISAAIPSSADSPKYPLPSQSDQISLTEQEAQKSRPVTNPQQTSSSSASAPSTSQQTSPSKPRRKLRARKAAMTLTPAAISQLRHLLDQPDPKMIRVGVRNRGCSGLSYHLEYVEKPGPFDEVVEQDGVKVLIDSKALFSIIGSEMDWHEDKLSSRFIFRNPNIKGECGCGESFMV